MKAARSLVSCVDDDMSAAAVESVYGGLKMLPFYTVTLLSITANSEIIITKSGALNLFVDILTK